MKLNKYQIVYILLSVALFIGLAASVVVEITASLVVFRDGRDQFMWIVIVMAVIIALLLVVLTIIVLTFIRLRKESASENPNESESAEPAQQAEESAPQADTKEESEE